VAIDSADINVIDAKRADGIGNEQHIEFGALQDLRELDPACDVVARVRVCFRQAPAGQMIVAVHHHEDGQLDLRRFSTGCGHCKLLESWPAAEARIDEQTTLRISPLFPLSRTCVDP
jgi:hypothetical protein